MSKPVNLHSADETVATRPGRGVIIASGDDKPADLTSGYAKGCIFIQTGASDSGPKLYVNTSTDTSCVFTALD
jgi:hypothetical protein